MTNCKQCGAPLHNNKCDYCGADYRDVIPVYRIDKYDHSFETLGCAVEIPLNCVKYMNEMQIAEMVKMDMARMTCEKITDYMDIETWVRPETLYLKYLAERLG